MSDEFPAAGTGRSDEGEPPSRTKRGWLIAASVILVLVVAGCIVSAIALFQAGAKHPDAGEPPVETASPATPTPRAVETPDDPDVVALPVACETIYSPALLSEFQSYEYWPLNDASLATEPISRVEPVEALRQTLPGLRCTWGLPSETGILSSVSEVTEDQAAEAIDMLEASGFDCREWNGGIHCTVMSLDEDGVTPRVGESHYFRGNIWIATWWSFYDLHIDAYTGDIVAQLWP